MKIKKVFLNDNELSQDEAQKYYEKYVLDYMTRECFFGGANIQTPEGILRAEVSLF